jgi:hypothetical protein
MMSYDTDKVLSDFGKQWPWRRGSRMTLTLVSSNRSSLKITFTLSNRLTAAGNDGISAKPAANEAFAMEAEVVATPLLP